MAALGYASYHTCYELLAKNMGMRALATAQVAANLVKIDNNLVNQIRSLDIQSSQIHPATLDFL